ncbi:MAG: hypothetical protein V8T23_06500 [Prevotella sp.]
MKKTILIACLGLVSLGLQAQSISLAGEWNVELGKSGSAFAKSKRASQGEVKRAILPGPSIRTIWDSLRKIRWKQRILRDSMPIKELLDIPEPSISRRIGRRSR